MVVINILLGLGLISLLCYQFMNNILQKQYALCDMLCDMMVNNISGTIDELNILISKVGFTDKEHIEKITVIYETIINKNICNELYEMHSSAIKKRAYLIPIVNLFILKEVYSAWKVMNKELLNLYSQLYIVKYNDVK